MFEGSNDILDKQFICKCRWSVPVNQKLVCHLRANYTQSLFHDLLKLAYLIPGKRSVNERLKHVMSQPWGGGGGGGQKKKIFLGNFGACCNGRGKKKTIFFFFSIFFKFLGIT